MPWRLYRLRSIWNSIIPMFVRRRSTNLIVLKGYDALQAYSRSAPSSGWVWLLVGITTAAVTLLSWSSRSRNLWVPIHENNNTSGGPYILSLHEGLRRKAPESLLHGCGRLDQRSASEILKPGLNQSHNNSKNHRSRNAEQKRSVCCFQRSKQFPRRRHNQISVTQGRVVDR